ncbi:helix-turn-helix domain-containing protein [Dictyobacter arantiisoli]|uniref:HTH cro/C1-type domain-containing protein n=1 Tax=Dictyobacter arantiisoli TaxID=2014874 RepID=A0A5A5T6Z4_9CHLR|nr:helix-turn-helix domain-containing protein [Dictyobacter arantiisoli]GCF07251.1 hypothetical protein KDI_08150 [Dictyobacter arantiisoli]
MTPHTLKTRNHSPLSQIVREYRDKFNLTQEQLAHDLSVDVRTLRRWESGETVLNDVRELRRVADLLGAEPERLGITKSTYTAVTLEQVDSMLEHIWYLIDVARSMEADMLITKLIQDLNAQLTDENVELLRRLAQALHLAGYVKSVTTRSNEAYHSLHQYAEMERVARLIQDDTLLNIALTYEGDMYCRGGNIQQGIQYLEAARDTTPRADTAARGNGIQLLGRAYLRVNQIKSFEQAMAQAEELSQQIDPRHSSTRGQYSLGTVYEEYGRSYTRLGKIQPAMDYLDKAEKTLEPTKHWEILIKTARAMALVRGGEIQSGVQLAVESVEQCREYGTVRLMERIYGIQNHIDRLTRDIGMVGAKLHEALDGPVEYAIKSDDSPTVL